MKNMRIGARLAIGFGLVLVLMSAITVIGVWRLQEVGSASDYMVKEALQRERLAQDWLSGTTSNGVRTVAMMKSNDAADQKYFQQAISETSKHISEVQKSIDAMKKDPAEQQHFNAVAEKRKVYTDVRGEIMKVKAAGQDDVAKQMVLDKMIPALDAYVASVHKVLEYEKEQIDKSSALIDAEYRTGRLLLIGLGVAAIIIGFVFATTLTKGITKPLGDAVKVAQTVAAGDLTTRIDVATKDETGQLLQALKGMNESLLRTVSQVRGGTDTIATASAQIAAGNMDLSSRTEEQASSLEETASSMEELTSTVKQNADNARQANQLAMTASEVAAKGGDVVSQVVKTMGGINESSHKMADIINVIDGIAFQTNILALNAAVEAARAGEQGRGFAVVATEVRSLAQRSAAAAREIKTLIDDSVNKVESGSKLVAEAGETMEEVVSSIRRVNDIMGEITAASQEQSDGIEQVNQAITQMDTVTQQNAALVEESAAAAESMQEQAATLAQLVSVFNLGTAGQTVAQVSKKKLVAPQKTPAKQQEVKPVSKQVVPSTSRTPRKTSGDNEDWEEF